jgi:hypothetical protein
VLKTNYAKHLNSFAVITELLLRSAPAVVSSEALCELDNTAVTLLYCSCQPLLKGCVALFMLYNVHAEVSVNAVVQVPSSSMTLRHYKSAIRTGCVSSEDALFTLLLYHEELTKVPQSPATNALSSTTSKSWNTHLLLQQLTWPWLPWMRHSPVPCCLPGAYGP